MSRQKSFGIDFGTTNSSAVLFQTTRIESRFQEYGERGRPIPSFVAIDRMTGERQVGRSAWERRAELEQSCECIPSIKSALADERWSRTVAGQEWRPVDVAYEIIDAVKAATNGRLDLATLAIPVGLKPLARSVLRQAATSAGIEVEALVSESTAAFFAYYGQLKSAENVAVFDWGGGTLDVSILSHSRGRVTELATSGMQAAGDKIDQLIAGRIHAKVAEAAGVDIPFEKMAPPDRDLLVVRSEDAKISLTESDSALIRIIQYGQVGLVREKISYEWFEDLVTPLVESAIECLNRAITQSGLSDGGIDRVLLVGGSSNLRPLRERMARRFGDKLLAPDDSVWSVSKGASILSYAPGAYVAAQNVDIVLADGSHFHLLREGERVDGWRKSVVFGITDTSQTLRVVFSGSKDIDMDDDHINVIDVPGYRFLEERLTLEAEVDENLVFRVKLKSSMRPERDTRVWEYDRLKLSYDVSDWSL